MNKKILWNSISMIQHIEKKWEKEMKEQKFFSCKFC